MNNRLTALLLVTGALLLVGCPPRPWRPPPPAGTHWAYTTRGAHLSSHSVVAGRFGRVPVGLVFARSGYKDARSLRRADRFWRGRKAAEHRFNAHLGQQGESISPGEDGPRVGVAATSAPVAEPPAPPPPPREAPPPAAERPAPAPDKPASAGEEARR